MAINNATLYYFEFPGANSTVALGENLNLFLKDSGIEYTYVREQFGDAFKGSDLRKKLIDQKLYSATLPAVEIDGKFYNKTAPTMRYLSKKLGKYTGKNDEENYYLDTVADVTRDYLQTWLNTLRVTDEEKLKEHFENDTKKYLGIFNNIYGEHQGPYVLGEEITYPDFLVYHILDDDKALGHLADYPNLQQFVNTFIQRPNLTSYLTSLNESK